MARKIVRSSKKSAPATKPKAASNKARRTTEEIDALVPDIVKALKAGKTMQDIKAKFGFSHGQPVRQALARNGYDSKGNSLALDPIKGSGATLAKRVAKLREQGTAWYLLANATGKSEAELKTLLKENGFNAEGRVYTKSEKPAPKAKAAPKKAAKAKSAKATKADPSS